MTNYDFDSKAFERMMERNCFETRQKWKEFTKDQIFVPRFDISIHDEKELALARLQKLAEQKAFSVYDFKTNPLNVFANHEMAGFTDGSFATKLTVQLNLFGGTAITLGTERHAEIIKGIDTLKVIGCFALTELGYGNNAVEMETTATWDAKTQEFIINSPSTLSQKYWITNGSLHSNFAIVFAQLYVNGKHEGIHVFLVRIRKDDKSLSDGVFIEDMGHKLGLNGVDNARIAFNNVRIPKSYILNKYSDIDEQGNFKSTIAKRRDRFLYVADRLLSGRLCIASMIDSCARITLATAFRFGSKRLAVGEKGKSDAPISEFNLFQNALYPLLAKTVCLRQALNVIKDIYSQNQLQGGNTTLDIIRLCCFIKPFVTWNCREVAAQCVERSGGQGYLSVNRMSQSIAFAHSGITAEGDNCVLMQKVAKELMSGVQSGEYKTPKTTKSLQEIGKLTDISDVTILADLTKIRESYLIKELAVTTQEMLLQKKTIYDIWMKEKNYLVQALSNAFGERQVLDFNLQELQKVDPSVKNVYTLLCQIHFAQVVLQNMSFYMSIGAVSAEAFKNLEKKFRNDYIRALHPQALKITNSFGIPEHLMFAPAANDFVDYNSRPNRGELINVQRSKL